MTCPRRTLTAAMMTLLLAAPAWAAEVTLESLLHEMIGREHLAQFPAPAYSCRQFSSYDRETVAPDKPGWFANWDRSQWVRVEENEGRREWVMMDADGPGAVVHIWGTWHGPGGGPFSNGTMRVYLDGQPKPAIEGPIADLISGDKLVAGPLSESVSPTTEYERRGHNLYLPIPYARHCKITYESDKVTDIGAQKGEALYYQVNYRTYEPGTQVQSFTRDELARLEPLVTEVGQRLVDSGMDKAAELKKHPLEANLAPADETEVKLEGPAAIRQLSVRLEADDLEQALRSTVLEIAFDGQRTVWCPVGDFFGTGYQLHAFRTWYTQAQEDGTLRAWWVMPFEKSCRITLRNIGDQAVKIDAVAESGPWSWDDRSLHFHAAWRQYTKIDTGPNKDQTGNGAFDVNYIEVEGQGQYAGDTLTLFNGTSAWWGEGDEKIFVDGEPVPSHIGTGTEDYYGYAWCRPEYFEAPFHAQPSGAGNLTVGFTVNSRYRSLDAIPFTTSLKFDMELWHWRNTRMNFAPATFWYARPGAKWNVEPDPESAALPVARKRSDVVETFEAKGAIEGESLKILEKTGGTTEIQALDEWQWSGDQQLWWRDGKPGDKLVLEVPCAEAGKYRVRASLTKAVDYGTVRIRFNDQPPTVPIDRFNRGVAHDLIDLGEFTLQKGPNRMIVEIVGARPEAVKKYMFGLDYLRLEKSP